MVTAGTNWLRVFMLTSMTLGTRGFVFTKAAKQGGTTKR